MKLAPASLCSQSLGAPVFRRCRRGGFTLLEMVIVLAIMVLLMGLAVVSFDTLTHEQELRRPVSELQRMAQEAVQRAVLYEQAQVINFDAKGFSMRYKTDANGRVSADDAAVWQRRVDTPANIKLSLRRFGSQKFASAAGQRLVVAPGGLCEPLTARFELGASWIEVTFDALSGGVLDERMIIQ